MKPSFPRLRRVIWHDGSSSDDAPKPGAQIIKLDGITTLDLDPNQVLLSAVGNVTDVMIVGWDLDGNLYFASSPRWQ